MNYSLINFIASEKKITAKEMAEACDMTHTGYLKMMKKETMTVANLEIITKKLSMPIHFWWKDDEEMKALDDQDRFLQKIDSHYIHREAFLELKKSWREEREVLLSQIKFLQNFVNQTIPASASNKAS